MSQTTYKKQNSNIFNSFCVGTKILKIKILPQNPYRCSYLKNEHTQGFLRPYTLYLTRKNVGNGLFGAPKGMCPLAFCDTLTCTIGVHTIYLLEKWLVHTANFVSLTIGRLVGNSDAQELALDLFNPGAYFDTNS